MAQQDTLSQFQSIGHDLFIRGLVSSHGGNMSIRTGDRLIITRRGSMLGHLTKQDLVEIGIEGESEVNVLASVELPVHRAIYRKTPALAIVHAHPPHAIALSMTEDEIVPVDIEGSYLLQKTPVLGSKAALEAEERAEILSEALEKHKIALLWGQGSFAAAQTLEEAHHWTSALEASCQIMWLIKLLGVDLENK